MSTGLNSMSGVIYQDMIRPCLKKPLSDVEASYVMKIIVMVVGVICVALVLLVERLSGLIQAGKSLSGITAGPLLGIFTLGMFSPYANSTGAITGALVSLCLVAWISLGTQAALATGKLYFPIKPVSTIGCSPETLLMSQHHRTNANISFLFDKQHNHQPFALYRMSYLWYTWVGFLTAILVGSIVSWLTGCNQYKSGVDEKLYTPAIRNYLNEKFAKVIINIR